MTAIPSESASASGSQHHESDLEDEVTRLRERVASLERELVEVQARANAAVAEWQERAYWLDRWHLDLNALMRKRGAAEFRALLRGIRGVGRVFRRLKRRLLS
jgi:predicted  nucleic acid-binding Zn-ribbon protein